jgi:predicted RND superfamily exporter protein
MLRQEQRGTKHAVTASGMGIGAGFAALIFRSSNDNVF